jgi:hypothetical protein
MEAPKGRQNPLGVRALPAQGLCRRFQGSNVRGLWVSTGLLAALTATVATILSPIRALLPGGDLVSTGLLAGLTADRATSLSPFPGFACRAHSGNLLPARESMFKAPLERQNCCHGREPVEKDCPNRWEPRRADTIFPVFARCLPYVCVAVFRAPIAGAWDPRACSLRSLQPWQQFCRPFGLGCQAKTTKPCRQSGLHRQFQHSPSFRRNPAFFWRTFLITGALLPVSLLALARATPLLPVPRFAAWTHSRNLLRARESYVQSSLRATKLLPWA